MKVRRAVCCAVAAALIIAFSASPAVASPPTKVYEFSIVGTHIEFDEFGLPSRLEGVVYYRGGPRNGKLAGTYTEELTPIFFEGAFVGTSGVSVFNIQNSQFTTLNTSYIVGMLNGAFLIESSGVVVKDDGTGKFKKVKGEMVSSSAVILGPEFSMNVDLTLSATRVPK